MNLRAGLRQKIAFRLGCHELQCSRKRYVKTRKDKCPCCGADESETIQHAMFECTQHQSRVVAEVSSLPVANHTAPKYHIDRARLRYQKSKTSCARNFAP